MLQLIVLLTILVDQLFICRRVTSFPYCLVKPMDIMFVTVTSPSHWLQEVQRVLGRLNNCTSLTSDDYTYDGDNHLQ